MFTGIVEAVGKITALTHNGDARHIEVHADLLDLSDVVTGDSVAVNGCCLTVVAKRNGVLGFDVSAETLQCTHGLDRQGPVNLEKALRFGERLGGHLVTGHVDGTGLVTRISPGVDGGGSKLMEIQTAAERARFIAAKGSITVNGVSLTVNTVTLERFTVNLIPHTLSVTTLGRLDLGSVVNLEIDIIARYVERLLTASK